MDFNQTMFNNMIAAYLLVLVTTCLVLAAENDEFSTPPIDVGAFVQGAAAARRIEKRRQRDEEETDNGTEASKRSRKSKHDFERARMCVYQDYLGPDPLFGRQFERIFRVTRGIFERVWQKVAAADNYFVHTPNPVDGKAIYPEAKVLMGLKQLAFGVSPIAFVDYFQMGETSGRSCLKRLAKALAHDKELRAKHLRKPSKADAKAISNLHEELFGYPGNLGCLDCMHVYWRTCPAAWQGQFRNGKEDQSSMVLEAVADYNTWFWHSFFGTPGTCNDINIWDQSPLLKSMLDGTMEEWDFDYTIGEQTFQQLHFMVDGIYPEISRFVKTVAVPLNGYQTNYAAWQEGGRKMIERAFGILQRKFQMLCRPVELFYMCEIADIVDTCLILHNMMVEVRMERDEPEHLSTYDVVTLDENADRDALLFREERVSQRAEAAATDAAARISHNNEDADRQHGVAARWNAGSTERNEAVKAQWELNFEAADERWDALHNEAEHHRLKHALIQSVAADKKNNRKEKE